MAANARVAIVTGGRRGIGRAIVERLLAQGAAVATCGRGPRPRDLAASVLWIQADVAAPQDARRLVRSVRDALGRISILVNNAGVQLEKTLPETSDGDWDAVVGTNARGAFNMCREVLGEMATEGGIIINIGSISGLQADPGMALYNATKGFIHGLSRSIATDHGPRVRCNAVCPGWIMTDMAEAAFDQARDPAAAKRDALARHPVGRLGRPEDVAAMVAWLTSDEAAFVNGQCLVVDGGLTAASPLQPRLF